MSLNGPERLNSERRINPEIRGKVSGWGQDGGHYGRKGIDGRTIPLVSLGVLVAVPIVGRDDTAARR